MINNHLDAKRPDDADFGRFQPPVLFSEFQRTQGAVVLHNFVTSIEKANPKADVVLLGDLNDQGSPHLRHAGSRRCTDRHGPRPARSRAVRLRVRR